MAITLINIGGWATGTTSALVPYPSGVQAGDLLVLPIANKYPNNGPELPSGWVANANNQASGGSGVNGIDSGSVYATIFTKISDGNETGNLTLNVPSGNSIVCQMVLYRKAADKNWDLVCVNGNDNTAGTNWSVTAGSNPGITIGDRLITCSAINTDSYSFSNHAVSATGVTFGTVQADGNGTNLGEDCYCTLSDHEISSGTASAVPIFTMTSSGTATNIPTGATVILRMREVSATSYTLTAEPTAFNVTTNNASLLVNRKLTCNSVHHLVNSEIANLIVNRKLILQPCNFLITTNNINLIANRKISATTTPFIVTGYNVDLIYNPTGYTLTAESTSFTVSINDALLKASRVFDLQSGHFIVTGNNIGMNVDRPITPILITVKTDKDETISIENNFSVIFNLNLSKSILIKVNVIYKSHTATD